MDKKRYLFLMIMALAVLFLFVVIVMAINSRKPDAVTLTNVDTNIKGASFTRINQALIRQMYENWLPNDFFWPTLLLDNMPNFQIGELEVIRYNTRVFER